MFVKQNIAVLLVVTFVLPASVPAQHAGPAPAAHALLRGAKKSETPSQDEKSKDDDGSKDKDKDNDGVLPKSKVHNPVLWKQPDNIPGLDMYTGRGGEKHQPKPPFQFLSEDMNGTNPKFDVRDADDTKWRVKVGEEARPEVVASRFLWATGYFVNE